MENVRIIKMMKIILPLTAIFFMAIPIRAYSPNTTHHGLTSEIVKLFNHYYPDKKFNTEETNWLKVGSVDEDHDIRPMNHFYDPLSGLGLWGFSSSKEWSQDTLAQANRSTDYLSGTSNVAQPLFSSPTSSILSTSAKLDAHFSVIASKSICLEKGGDKGEGSKEK